MKTPKESVYPFLYLLQGEARKWGKGPNLTESWVFGILSGKMREMV